MRTPAGKECRYFLGDYYRGRQRAECLLLGSASPSMQWNAGLCSTCPVPNIGLANACKTMVLEPRLERPFPYIRKQVSVKTYCSKSLHSDFDPHIGCGQCHELPPGFTGEES